MYSIVISMLSYDNWCYMRASQIFLGPDSGLHSRQTFYFFFYLQILLKAYEFKTVSFVLYVHIADGQNFCQAFCCDI